MQKGISLHIGVNRVDDQHYRKNIFEGWKGELQGCESDALSMQTIAEAQGFESKILLTQSATRANVISYIQNASSHLKSGDYFFLTYSGHGGQVRDRSGDEKISTDSVDDLNERRFDRKDETWCLFDAQLLDDELFELWSSFRSGVRILVFSDSCHSGTVTRDPNESEIPLPPGWDFRFVPRSNVSATYKVHKKFYDKLQSSPGAQPEIAARVLLFSGCQDEELSREDQSSDPPGGLFTKGILKIWAPGKFNNYKAFLDAIKTTMPDDKQTPNFSVFGGEDLKFENEPPLII